MITVNLTAADAMRLRSYLQEFQRIKPQVSRLASPNVALTFGRLIAAVEKPLRDAKYIA